MELIIRKIYQQKYVWSKLGEKNRTKNKAKTF